MMNERINELEDQASQYASRETTDLDEWEFIFRKKFAELIIKECMKLNHEHFSDEDPYSIDSLYRQHFGVEE
jgi:hypothetical protein